MRWMDLEPVIQSEVNTCVHTSVCVRVRWAPTKAHAQSLLTLRLLPQSAEWVPDLKRRWGPQCTEDWILCSPRRLWIGPSGLWDFATCSGWETVFSYYPQTLSSWLSSLQNSEHAYNIFLTLLERKFQHLRHLGIQPSDTADLLT